MGRALERGDDGLRHRRPATHRLRPERSRRRPDLRQGLLPVRSQEIRRLPPGHRADSQGRHLARAAGIPLQRHLLPFLHAGPGGQALRRHGPVPLAGPQRQLALGAVLPRYIDLTFPAEESGVPGGTFRIANYGDGGTTAWRDLFLVNSPWQIPAAPPPPRRWSRTRSRPPKACWKIAAPSRPAAGLCLVPFAAGHGETGMFCNTGGGSWACPAGAGLRAAARTRPRHAPARPQLAVAQRRAGHAPRRRIARLLARQGPGLLLHHGRARVPQPPPLRRLPDRPARQGPAALSGSQYLEL